MTPVIATPRLSLRRAAPGDAGFFLELLNEPAFIRNIGDRKVRTEADALAYIADKIAASYAVHGFGLYVVELRDTGAPVGICGFVKREVLPHADIGFSFLERHWSRGYALESAAAVLEFGRTSLGFRRVLGVTALENPRSIRLLERLGLRFERLFDMPGHAEQSRLFSVDLGGPPGAEPASQPLPPVPAGYAERMPRQAEAADLEPVGLDASGREAFLAPGAARAWRLMRESARRDGAEILLVSAFRTVERQRAIVCAKFARGEVWGEILRASAYPGHSEHHTGRAVDVGAPGNADLTERFEASREFAWLAAHAARFGFAMSYLRGNAQGIAYEPWHWCFHPAAAGGGGEHGGGA
jgi:LAS superfamily LD-carboxypeptidase LdcB